MDTCKSNIHTDVKAHNGLCLKLMLLSAANLSHKVTMVLFGSFTPEVLPDKSAQGFVFPAGIKPGIYHCKLLHYGATVSCVLF